MTVKFLCDAHREMLNDDPGKAINAWQDSFDRGRALYDEKQWRQALPFLGSAYEAACIIMASRTIERDNAYELLTTSVVLVANAFAMLGYEAESRKIYSLTIYRLEQEQCNAGKSVCVLINILGTFIVI